MTKIATLISVPMENQNARGILYLMEWHRCSRHLQNTIWLQTWDWRRMMASDIFMSLQRNKSELKLCDIYWKLLSLQICPRRLKTIEEGKSTTRFPVTGHNEVGIGLFLNKKWWRGTCFVYPPCPWKFIDDSFAILFFGRHSHFNINYV